MIIFLNVTEEVCIKDRHLLSKAKIWPIVQDNLKRCKTRYKLAIYSLTGSGTRAFNRYRNQWPRMTLNGVMMDDARYLCGSWTYRRNWSHRVVIVDRMQYRPMWSYNAARCSNLATSSCSSLVNNETRFDILLLAAANIVQKNVAADFHYSVNVPVFVDVWRNM